MKKKIHYDP